MNRKLTCVLLVVLAACSVKQSTSESNQANKNNNSGNAPADVTQIVGKGPGSLPLRVYDFDTITADGARGKGRARYYVEAIGAVSLDMVEIPEGTFSMGSVPPRDESLLDLKDEQPLHRVTVKSYYLGKYEVTQAQWRAVASLPIVSRDLDPDPSKFKGDNLPVEQVSWKAAMEFCARLSRVTGRSYRLPTEAEWEYACRAGTTTTYAFGQSITPELVNYNDSAPSYSQSETGGRGQTTPVGSLGVANAFGLFDTHGNVSEWCLDYVQYGYVGAPNDGSVWRAPERTGKERSADMRGARGGSWTRSFKDCSASRRTAVDISHKSPSVGFRVVEQERTSKQGFEEAPMWRVSDLAKGAVEAFVAANKSYHLLAAAEIPQDWLSRGYDIQQVDMMPRAISEGDANGDGFDDALAIVVRKEADRNLYSVVCLNGQAGGGYNPVPFWVAKDSTDFIGEAQVVGRLFDKKYKYWTPSSIYYVNGLYEDGEPGDNDFYTWNGEQYEQGYFVAGERVQFSDETRLFSRPDPASRPVTVLKSSGVVMRNGYRMDSVLVILSSVPEKVNGVRWYKVQALKNNRPSEIVGFIAGDQISRWAEEH